MQFALTEYDCVSSSDDDDEDACPPSDDDIQALAFGVSHSHVNYYTIHYSICLSETINLFLFFSDRKF